MDTMSDKRIVVGQNGFGRFSLNLLWWWFSDKNAPYRIAYLHDENLTSQQIINIIKNDTLVTGFQKCKVVLQDNILLLQSPDGRREYIKLTHGAVEDVSWLGEPTLFFECSGARSTTIDLCRQFLVGRTKTVIVSATMYDADATLIMGFNHQEFNPIQHKIVSYGSCTVNPGILLSKFFEDTYGIVGCVVHVIHNVQKYRLDAGVFHTLQRKFCTLEAMAPKLLPFFSSENFKVKYTVVPWEGVSIIDFAFRLKKAVTAIQIVEALRNAVNSGLLLGFISLITKDTGPEVHVGSPYSAVIVEEDIVVVNDTVHLFCYFYNEGSGSRMHELACHIARSHGHSEGNKI